MLIVMSVVQVDENRREAFEGAFLGRDGHDHEAPGFAGFELLRRDRDGYGQPAHGNELRRHAVIDAKVPA